MKKKGIIAVALTASILAVPLAACGEGAEYKPADYAFSLQSEEVAELTTQNALYTKAAKINGRISPIQSNDNPYSPEYLPVAKLLNAAGKYVLFDLNEEKTLLNGKEFDAIDYDSSSHLLRLTLTDASDSDKTNTGYCTVKGEEFLPLGEYDDITLNAVSGYLNGSYKQTTVYSLTHTTENGTKETTKYYTFDAKNNQTTTISSSEFRTTAFDMSAGVTANAVDLQEFYDNDKANPLSTYAYSVEMSGEVDNPVVSGTYGAAITVYKDGAISGSVSLKNAFVLGTVGSCLYYYEVTAMPESAESGFNVVYQQNKSGVISTAKYDFTLYRYDILKGDEAKETSADYLYTEPLTPLYNHTESAYDKAAAEGYEFVKGVAFVSENVTSSQLILDDKLAVSFDQTEKPYTVATLIRLKENRYFTAAKNGSMGYILDENLNAIASVPQVTGLYAQEQLIVCRTNNKYMAVDFEGKIVFEPKYSSLNFYGGYARTNVTEKSGRVLSNMIVSKEAPNGKALKEVFADSETTGVRYNATSYGYVLKSETTGTTTAYSLYNYTGAKIGDVLGNASDTQTVGQKMLYFTVTDDGYITYIVS